MELLRQGTQGLGEQLHLLDVDGDLLRLGLENITADADDIADVILAEIRKLLLADGVGADVELDLPLVVLDVAEYRLAHAALGHDAPGDGDRLAVKSIVVVLYLARPCAAREFRLLERVSPLLLERRELVPADLQYLGKLHGVVCLIVDCFAHP